MLMRFAPVAQWIRASDYGSEGRGFESLRARQDWAGVSPICETPAFSSPTGPESDSY